MREVLAEVKRGECGRGGGGGGGGGERGGDVFSMCAAGGVLGLWPASRSTPALFAFKQGPHL